METKHMTTIASNVYGGRAAASTAAEKHHECDIRENDGDVVVEIDGDEQKAEKNWMLHRGVARARRRPKPSFRQ